MREAVGFIWERTREGLVEDLAFKVSPEGSRLAGQRGGKRESQATGVRGSRLCCRGLRVPLRSRMRVGPVGSMEGWKHGNHLILFPFQWDCSDAEWGVQGMGREQSAGNPPPSKEDVPAWQEEQHMRRCRGSPESGWGRAGRPP